MNILKQDEEFRYQLLGRLQMDCDYYLGNGKGHSGHLWAGDEKEQIKTMKDLWNSFDEKPEWLSMKEIEEYEKNMIKSLQE